MPLKSFNNYTADDAKHERLWKNALIVFDTSALLDMYFYSGKTKQVVIDEIFKKVKERLWIPYQVNYEFLKNRSNVILKPVGSYEALEKELKETVNDVFKKYQTGIREFKSKTKKDDKHPVIPQQIFRNIDEIQQQHESALKELSENIKVAINEQMAEIEKTKLNDVLYDAINAYFEVGTEMTFSQQLLFVEEGKKRYDVQIPPGYEDAIGKEKKIGTQIFGDLFLWKEIIDHARTTKKPIIFVCNDLKADWCVKKEGNSTYVDYPRHELIKEIWDEAGVEFWMYSNPQLLFYAQKFLMSEITADQIKEVNAVANERDLTNDGNLSCRFTWPVDETTGSPGEHALEKSLMYLLGHQNNQLKVDWGDESPLETINSNQSIYHRYPALGEYTVRIYGDLSWFCAMGIGPHRGTQFPKVSELLFTNARFLNRLQCFAGTLKELDLKTMTNLSQLLVGCNSISSLNLRHSNKLILLYCESNQLTELDVSENPNLEKLLCSGNQLSQLDLSNNSMLQRLNCRGNQLKRIDLSSNYSIVELNCANNKMEEAELNSIFRDLPVVENGKICIVGNPGTETCERIIATTKGWVFEQNAHYVPELGN